MALWSSNQLTICVPGCSIWNFVTLFSLFKSYRTNYLSAGLNNIFSVATTFSAITLIILRITLATRYSPTRGLYRQTIRVLVESEALYACIFLITGILKIMEAKPFDPHSTGRGVRFVIMEYFSVFTMPMTVRVSGYNLSGQCL